MEAFRKLYHRNRPDVQAEYDFILPLVGPVNVKIDGEYAEVGLGFLLGLLDNSI